MKSQTPPPWIREASPDADGTHNVEAPAVVPEKQGDGRGRNPIAIDLSRLEETAAMPFTPLNAVALKMGISTRTLNRRLEDTPVIRDAFERGRARASAALAEHVNCKMREKSASPLLTLAAANQRPELGGLGWEQPASRSRVEIGGLLKIVREETVLHNDPPPLDEWEDGEFSDVK